VALVLTEQVMQDAPLPSCPMSALPTLGWPSLLLLPLLLPCPGHAHHHAQHWLAPHPSALARQPARTKHAMAEAITHVLDKHGKSAGRAEMLTIPSSHVRPDFWAGKKL
jgi:hypothetical protein